MADARTKDFLGGGDDIDPFEGIDTSLTEEEILLNRQRRDARAEQARLSSVPYGTPASQGGTATTYEVPTQGIGTQPTRASGQPIRVIDSPDFDSDSSQIQLDTARRSDEGQSDRANALQSLIDRFDSIGLDTEAADQSRLAQGEAIQQNRELFRRATAFDQDAAAEKFSDEALASALAVARSAPGAASRESALFNALESLPQLQAEGQRLAQEEGREQERTALQAASQLGQLATATRGQDEQRAEAFAGLGLDVAKQIANSTGLNLQLDQRDREFLGEVALATARLDLDVERLGVEESLRLLEIELAKQGLEQEWRIFKESQKITGKDILGGVFGLAGAAIQGFATGKVAGR